MEIPENQVAPQKIGILAIEGFALMSYASTVEPLRAANLLSEKELFEVIDIGKNGRSGAQFRHCAGQPARNGRRQS